MRFAVGFVLAPVLVLVSLLGLVIGVRPSGTSAAAYCISPNQAAGDTQWDADQLANAATIIRVGKARQVPPKGLVVALAAALQESSLHNLLAGDRDSAGLFQMRPSTGWGTYAQVTDPVYAATAFFGGPDVPPANTGLLDVGDWQALGVAAAAQAVEKSAFPTAYSKWEAPARALVVRLVGADAGCSAAPLGANCPAASLPVVSGLTPGAVEVVNCVVDKFGITNLGGRATSGHIPDSDHYTGRAVDVMIADWQSTPGINQGTRIADYFTSNAEAFGVTYVIWRAHIWSTDRPGWRPYWHPGGGSSPTLLHMDHVHISVSGSTTP